MTERFKNAYDKLVKAYYDGTLKANDCTACAVGNIVGGNQWVLAVAGAKSGNDFFSQVVPMIAAFAPQVSGEQLLSLTGYTALELAHIENAFERNTKIGKYGIKCFSEHDLLQDQFNGLSAVLDVMLQLDNAQDADGALREKFRQRLVTA